MRYTKNMIEYKLIMINNKLKAMGIDRVYELNSRYNYYAIDYHKNGKTGSMTLESGLTTREAYYIVNALLEGVCIYE